LEVRVRKPHPRSTLSSIDAPLVVTPLGVTVLEGVAEAANPFDV